MKISVFNKIAAILVLLVFTYTNCNYFNFPEILPSIHTVPVGLGNMGAVFLDKDYKPTTTDEGILAIFAENNKYAKNVMVIAEIPGNHIDNNTIVRVINGNNDSLVTFFYNNGQKFPSKMAITVNGQTVTGMFSNYNILKQTYSIEFTDEGGEKARADNLFLNDNIFKLHEENAELTETQNARLQKIYTTLGLWASLSIQLEDFDSGIAARSIKINLKSLIVGVFVAVAVVALVATVVLAAPAALVVAGPLVTIGLSGTAAITGAATVVSAGTALLCDILLPDDLILEIEFEEHQDISPVEYKRPKIEISYRIIDNKPEPINLKIIAQNNQMTPFYLEQNESIIFDVKVVDFGSENSLENIIDLVNINDLVIAYDPNYSEYITFKQPNAIYFINENIVEDNNSIKINITRNSRFGSDGDGGINQGRVKFLLSFKCNVILNDVSKGVDFIDGVNDITTWYNLFIFNFTVINPNPEP